MKPEDLEPLPPDVQTLLDLERDSPEPPAPSRDRVRSRIQTTLAVPAVLGAVGLASDGLLPKAAAAKTGVASTLMGKLQIGVATFLLGGASGAGLYASFRPPEREVVYVTVPAPAPSAAPAAPVAERPAQPRRLAPPAEARLPNGRDANLAEERTLLDVARTAVGRGQAQAALFALEQHQSRFPKGQLSEEREALGIQALAALGRKEEAQERANRFRQSFPRSMLIPVVNAAAGISP